MIKSASRSSLVSDKKYSSMSAGTVPSNEFLIATTVVSGTFTSVISFDVSALGGTYKHLRLIATSQYNGNDTDLLMRFNGDTGTNYSLHGLVGRGGAPTVLNSTNTTNIETFYNWSPVTKLDQSFLGSTLDILDFSSTSKIKAVQHLYGVSYNSGGSIYLNSGSWRSTSAITSITLTLFGGAATHILPGSRFSLYGVTA